MRNVLQVAAVSLTVALTVLAADAQTMSPAPATPAVAPSPFPRDVPSPAATPVNPAENPLITERVRKAFLAWQSGQINRSEYSPYAGGTYIDALVGQVQPDLQAIGAPQTLTYETTSLLLGDYVYRYDVKGTAGVISVLYSLDARGKTDGIIFTPQIFAEPSPTPSP